MNEVTTTVSHEQWLEDRKAGLGGSDIGVILGLNPKKTPLDLWNEKTGRKDGSVDNNFTRAGVKMEPMVADWFEEKTGLTLINPGNNVQKHRVHDFVLGTPDRVTLNMKDKINGILEIKTTGNTIDRDNPPLTWFCQVNWYAGIKKSYGVSDCTTNYLAWFERMTCAFDFVEYTYDPDFVDFMINKAGEFWHNYIEKDTPPPAINGHDVAALYAKHQPGKQIIATPELAETIAQLVDLRKTIKASEFEEEKLKNTIMMIMNDAEAILVDGKPAITWKAAKDSLKFDTSKFQIEHPDLYQRYQFETSGSRRFLVK